MDGYYVEPAPPPQQDPFGLLSLPDDVFIATPHLGYFTDESISATWAKTAESVLSFLKGSGLPYVVNPGYRLAGLRPPLKALSGEHTGLHTRPPHPG
jgi:phosphoglycerate dehydrogenase-like enzyme